MMAVHTCPDGHQSQSGDWCDVCGAPISAGTGPNAAPIPATPAPTPATGPASAVNPLPPPAAGTRDCPSCQDQNPADALFCESCGLDFATGEAPSNPLVLEPPASRKPASSAPATVQRATGKLSAAAPVAWIIEQWVDPEWYAVNGDASPDPCPTPGLPRTSALREPRALVGRVSTSKGVHPDVDCSSDTGVSRRQAQLSCEADRWSIEDLGSTNGTFVGHTATPIPTTPLVSGTKHELADDDRIYVGAWTRLVIRRATAAEGGA
jgi:hypothetical protein